MLGDLKREPNSENYPCDACPKPQNPEFLNP